MSKLDSVEFDHEKAISEEGITKGQLPSDIRGKIQAFNMQRTKLGKKGDENIDGKDIARLEAMSVKIAGDIYDHLENEVEEMEAEKKKNAAKTAPAAATTPAPATEPAPATVASVITPEPTPTTTTAAAEPAPAATTPAAKAPEPTPAAKDDKDFVLFDGLI